MGLEVRVKRRELWGHAGVPCLSPVVLGRSGCNLEFNVKQPVCGTVLQVVEGRVPPLAHGILL